MSLGRLVVSVIAALVTSFAGAAPDEELLGKSQGYPACIARQGPLDQHCLVGLYSHFDQLVPARKVAKGDKVTPLREASAPQLNADRFMDENRNTGLLVLKGDTILAERYQYGRKPTDRLTSQSMAKTLVSMLLGIAIAERKIGSVDDLASQYVRELKGHPYGETKLRHLLTMSSGVRFSEVYDGRDDVSLLARNTILQQGPGGAHAVKPFTARARPAGEKFSYASAETEVLGLAVRAATGKPLAEYLSEKIWQPMGAEADASWLIDAGGYEIAYCCFNAALRDWGRLGLLMANEGSLGSRQIIPAQWIRAATRAEAPHLEVGTATRLNGYGYQTWLIDKRGRFALLGARGQAVFIDPASKIVMVHAAVHRDARDVAARRNQFEYFYATLKTLGAL